MRKPVIAGNWKMYKTIAEAVDFVEKIKPVAAQARHCEVIVAPPFTALAAAAAAAKGSKVSVAAQNCHWDKEGAHTGDVSTGMLRDAGCTHVIIGHSERRHDCGETDERVNKKVKAALAAEQGKRLLQSSSRDNLRGKRNSAMLSMLHGCSLRHGQLLGLNPNSTQLREERWGIAHLIEIIASDERTTAALKLPSRWPRTAEAQSSWQLC
jgi:hypothetical protein